ncbi:MAG: hypothetical protein AAF335_01235 [Bacteroidota bacterium]
MPSKRPLRRLLLHLLLQAISTATLPLQANLRTMLKKALLTTWVVIQVGKGLDKPVIHTLGQQGTGGDMQLNTQGYPVITTIDPIPPYPLTLTFCHATTCTNPTRTVVDNSTQTATFSSLQLGEEEHPIISYCKGATKIAFCHDTFCKHNTLIYIDSNPNSCTQTFLQLYNKTYAVITYFSPSYGLQVATLFIPSLKIPTHLPTKAPLTIQQKPEPFPKKEKKTKDGWEKILGNNPKESTKALFVIALFAGLIIIITSTYLLKNYCKKKRQIAAQHPHRQIEVPHIPVLIKALKKKKCHFSLTERVAISAFIGGVIGTALGFTIICLDEYIGQETGKALVRFLGGKALPSINNNQAVENQAGHIGAMAARILADRTDPLVMTFFILGGILSGIFFYWLKLIYTRKR